MTVLQKPLQSGDGHAGKRWYEFGRADQSARYTEAWEHETFAEEQARWERNDPAYARICDAARQAKEGGGEASRHADEAKADWDARVATARQTDDDAQRARHLIRAGEGHHHMHTTSAAESIVSPAPGIMPEPVRVQEVE